MSVELPPVPGPGTGDRAAMVFVAVGHFGPDMFGPAVAGWIEGAPGRDAGVMVAAPEALARVTDQALGAWLRGMLLADTDATPS